MSFDYSNLTERSLSTDLDLLTANSVEIPAALLDAVERQVLLIDAVDDRIKTVPFPSLADIDTTEAAERVFSEYVAASTKVAAESEAAERFKDVSRRYLAGAVRQHRAAVRDAIADRLRIQLAEVVKHLADVPGDLIAHPERYVNHSDTALQASRRLLTAHRSTVALWHALGAWDNIPRELDGRLGLGEAELNLAGLIDLSAVDHPRLETAAAGYRGIDQLESLKALVDAGHKLAPMPEADFILNCRRIIADAANWRDNGGRGTYTHRETGETRPVVRRSASHSFH